MIWWWAYRWWLVPSLFLIHSFNKTAKQDFTLSCRESKRWHECMTREWMWDDHRESHTHTREGTIFFLALTAETGGERKLGRLICISISITFPFFSPSHHHHSLSHLLFFIISCSRSLITFWQTSAVVVVCSLSFQNSSPHPSMSCSCVWCKVMDPQSITRPRPFVMESSHDLVVRVRRKKWTFSFLIIIISGNLTTRR